MSQFIAVVEDIDKHENITIIEFSIDALKLSMMSLALHSKIKVGSQVRLVVNSSQVALGKNFSGELSFTNQIKSEISTINHGKLLSHISLTFGTNTLESIISKKSSLSMNLKVGESVVAFIKASELSIVEVLDV